MGDIDEMVMRMNKKAIEEIFKIQSEVEGSVKWFKNYAQEIRDQIFKVESNYNKPIFQNQTSNKNRSSKRLAETSSSDDEADVSSTRVQLHDSSENSEILTGKPRRNAAKNAQANIKKVSNMKLNTKMRQPSKDENTVEFIPAKIKIEKKSESMLLEETSALSATKSSILSDVTNEMNMPPPAAKPKRGRKKVKKEVDDTEIKVATRVTRSTRTRPQEQPTEPKQTRTVKTKSISPHRKDSDVLIQEVPVSVIVVTDSESETEKSLCKSVVPNKQIENVDEIVETEIVTNSKSTGTEEEKSAKSKRDKKPKKQPQSKMKLKIKEEKNTDDEVKNNTQNDVQEVSVYEDALSENKTDNTHEKCVDEMKQVKSTEDKHKVLLPSTKTVNISPKQKSNTINSVLNDTHVIMKDPSKAKLIERDLSPAIAKKLRETGVQMNCTVVLQAMNETFTLNQQDNATNNKHVNLNQTKILTPKQTAEKNKQQNKINILPINNSLLTDDDDSIEVSVPTKTPIKQQQESTKKAVKTKPIFSPYGNSPVKKRVAAFEKLGTTDLPARVTRTKTRNLAAAADKEQTNTIQEATSNRAPPSSMVKSMKHFTPLMNNKIPSMIPHTDGKQYKLNKNTSVMSSDASIKSLTAVKASRAELQERREEEQKRKLEREDEVKRKKEAMLHAKTEEQKRKREEKQLKAQKAREAKEREKEEKIRRIIQEKEEKLQKEEQMKREWVATMSKKAAEEEKRQQMLKQEKLKQQRKLNQKPPPLPTDDLQDSDEEEENPKHKYIGPLWSQRQNLYPTLYAQRYVPNYITKEFFQMQPQTPDLLEIFENINADVLRRNSSAVWRTPPRYSTLPKF